MINSNCLKCIVSYATRSWQARGEKRYAEYSQGSNSPHQRLVTFQFVSSEQGKSLEKNPQLYCLRMSFKPSCVIKVKQLYLREIKSSHYNSMCSTSKQIWVSDMKKNFLLWTSLDHPANHFQTHIRQMRV